MEALLECGAAEGWLLARDLDGGATPLHCAVKVGAADRRCTSHSTCVTGPASRV